MSIMLEPTQTITIELPLSVIHYLSRVGQLTQQSLMELAAQSIRGNLPPTVDNAPSELQPDLIAMQRASMEQLREIAHLQIAPPDQARHLTLLEKLHDDTISIAERQELTQLRLQADQLMLRKAYAWSLLRWHGERIPRLNELPLASFSDNLRQQIFAEADHRCEYCYTSRRLIGMPLVIDHIIPKSVGGSDERENLAAACYRCNEFKWAKTQAIDPESGATVTLFHPRTQRWADHFAWANGGLYIVGLTEIGRATVVALHLNNEYVVESRAIWIAYDWHPPQ